MKMTNFTRVFQPIPPEAFYSQKNNSCTPCVPMFSLCSRHDRWMLVYGWSYVYVPDQSDWSFYEQPIQLPLATNGCSQQVSCRFLGRHGQLKTATAIWRRNHDHLMVFHVGLWWQELKIWTYICLFEKWCFGMGISTVSTVEIATEIDRKSVV